MSSSSAANLTAEQLKKQAKKQRQRDAKAKMAPAPALAPVAAEKGKAEASIEAFAMDVDAKPEPKKQVQMYTDASTTSPSTCADSEVGDSEVGDSDIESSSGAHRRGINKAKPLEGIPENKLGVGKKVPVLAVRAMRKRGLRRHGEVERLQPGQSRHKDKQRGVRQ